MNKELSSYKTAVFKNTPYKKETYFPVCALKIYTNIKLTNNLNSLK